MVAALVLGWLALAVLIFEGGSYIVYDILNPGDPWYGMGFFAGGVLLVPSAIAAVLLAFVTARYNWARAGFTVVVFLWAMTWFTFVARGDMGGLWFVTVALVGLTVAVILAWLPASRDFFRRRPASPGWSGARRP